MVGFTYASEFRARAAYQHSVETTIYLDRNHVGKGNGILLYKRLIELLADSSIHALIAIIALPNESSVALHEKLGFVKVGRLPEIGRKFGRWVDTGYWQMTLEDKD